MVSLFTACCVFQNNMSVYDYVRELETPTPAKSKPRGRRWRDYNVIFLSTFIILCILAHCTDRVVRYFTTFYWKWVCPKQRQGDQVAGVDLGTYNLMCIACVFYQELVSLFTSSIHMLKPLSQCRDLRLGEIWVDLRVLTTQSDPGNFELVGDDLLWKPYMKAS